MWNQEKIKIPKAFPKTVKKSLAQCLLEQPIGKQMQHYAIQQ